MSQVNESTYKGSPVLVIRQQPDEPYPFQFGLRKARMILSHIEDIRRFVVKYEKVTVEP